MTTNGDDGVSAIQTIIAALKPLDETTRQNVLEFVFKQLGIRVATSAPVAQTIAPASDVTYEQLFGGKIPSPKPDSVELDIRTLAEQKKPKTVNDKVAVLGYYLKTQAPLSERRDFITTDDISNYFPAAGFELPTAPRMALTNAKNAGYLNSLGNGQFRLNPVGHNLVTHKLPIGEASLPKRPKSKKRATKKKAR